MALFNNYFEIRLDAKKITALCARPNPVGAATIGTFMDILTVVSFIAVLVNTLICTFYVELIDKWTHGNIFYKALVFIITERCIVLTKFIISYVVDDVPREIQEHLARERYIVDVLINGVEEELEEVKKRRNTLLSEYESFSYESIPSSYPEEHFASNPAYCGKMEHAAQNLAKGLQDPRAVG